MIRKLDTTRVSLKAETLAAKFAHKIIGQQKATDTLISLMEKFQSGFYDRRKPIASLLFLGPTGVGKTGSVEAFVEGVFGSVTNMMKVDCAEFVHSHEIAKLLGSPPGYLGHRETHPFFTNASVFAARTNASGVEVMPFTVILFDEIEKANDALWNLLLGILDKGSLTNGNNEVVDLTKTVIILTSNVGSKELAVLAGEGAFGFSTGPTDAVTDYETQKKTVIAAAERKFLPEFMNRLDEVVIFNSLTKGDIDEITKLEFQNVHDRIVMTSLVVFDFEISPSAYAQVIKGGYDKKYNARNLKRVIDRNVTVPLSRLVATGQVLNNDTIIVDYKDEKWEYFAKATTKSGPREPSIQSGRVEVPTLRTESKPTPTSPSLPFAGGYPFVDKPDYPVLDMSRKDSSPFFDRRSDRYKR
jgi:ATP-dependent Clp protease ATP-binding subunit ClpA